MQSSQHADTATSTDTGTGTDPATGPGPGPGHVVVIGGGISGLAAAHRLATAGARVTLLEATGRLGGKLQTGEIAGTPVDLGAESMLARRPEGIALARAAGLGDRLQPPATSTAAVWTRDALRPLPKGHVMGVPGSPEALAGLLSPQGVARIAQERELPPAELGEDVAIGAYVADRLGREVVDRLVEPLLGGVYAGDAYRISMRASVPLLFEAARSRPSLLDAVREVQRQAAAQQQDGPVFMGVAGGVGTLPDAVADAVRAHGGEIRTGTAVLGLSRSALGWQIRTDRRILTADAVVLAAPAWAAADLLAAESPAAAAELGRIEYASMALVTLAFRRSEVSGLPDGSGFLVPPADGRTIKAATFSSRKWRWVTEGSSDLFVLRTSIGRYGEEEHLHRDDADLVAVSLRDLGAAVGIAAKPVAHEVTRWIGGLPQYPVGHLARVARIRAEVAGLPGLRVCGAAYDGVGIPACIADGQRAADEILATPTLARGTDRGTGQ
ncbi:protoporphyrinogen oxidase [Streptomyces katsurahamanus]|uniref:Coproporphyrinogen III oxidase n=1 Tax=Streptomyces katsurahamanus TaxID=2577098 RepID=A0ABW9NP80_9ACTN|nr:protoporphyrinogen oxidase [Streptomyces katsurahamanus]MQS35080.1 protoporphyrinogen oxidase [Streptomyces katsurahamanus]